MEQDNKPLKIINFANNLAEAFFLLKNVSGMKPVGACTRLGEMPDRSFSVKNIAELKIIDRHERYIDVGSAVTLSQLLEVGAARLPGALYEALNSIATPLVRNIATIGGNICGEEQKMTLYAPLLALDAKLEFKKNVAEIQQITLRKYTSMSSQYLLTKIRIPIEDWNISIFRRLGKSNCITEDMAGYTFLASIEKDMISNVRLAFAGQITFRSKAIEDKLLGCHLPLNEKIIEAVYSESTRIYDEEAKKYEELHQKSLKPILRQQFLNLVNFSLEQLT